MPIALDRDSVRSSGWSQGNFVGASHSARGTYGWSVRPIAFLFRAVSTSQIFRQYPAKDIRCRQVINREKCDQVQCCMSTKSMDSQSLLCRFKSMLLPAFPRTAQGFSCLKASGGSAKRVSVPALCSGRTVRAKECTECHRIQGNLIVSRTNLVIDQMC